MTRYTDIEMKLYAQYVNLLRDVCIKQFGDFDGVCMNSAKCSVCARIAPAGIPRQLRDSDRVLCAACVRHRAVIGPLVRELHGADGARAVKDSPEGSLIAAVTKSLTSRREANPVKTDEVRLARLAVSIKRLEAQVDEAKTDDEKFARARIVAAARAGYRKQSGGKDLDR